MNLKTVSHNGVTFINSSKLGKAEISYLKSNFEFNQLHMDDHINKTELPKIETTKNYILMVVGFPISSNQNSKQEEEDAGKNGIDRLLDIPKKTLSHIPLPKFPIYVRKERILTTHVDIYIGNNYVVVLNEGAISQIDHIFEVCQRTIRGREEFLGRGTGFLAYKIIDVLFDGYFPIVNAISGIIDKIDREIEKRQTPGTLEDISITRRNIVVLHTMIKTIIPLLKGLRDGAYNELNGPLQPYWGNVMNHAQSLLEKLEDDRELIEGISESNEFLLRTKTNEIMKVLTILFTLTIPITVLGTVYGMNILLPGGLGVGSWNFLGPYTTLIFVLVASFLPIVLMLWYFKHRRWF